MPTTTYNIDRIIERVPKKSREEIRGALNEIQLIVYSQNCFQTMKIESTGLPPILTTTIDVYEYDAPSDCRETESIIALSEPSSYNRTRPIGPRKEYFFRGVGYKQIAATSRPATIDTVGKVWFEENPGTTTDKYYHVYYVKPTEVSDEDIQLTIQEEVHYLMREGVVALFTAESYGASGYDMTVVEKIAKKVRAKLNSGYNAGGGTTPVQPEYQDYEFNQPWY